MKNNICKIDKEILRTIYNHRRPMTIHEIKKITNISWVTVKKHLEKLSDTRPKIIIKKKMKNRTFYAINYEAILVK